jgi:hypothetical protein
MNDRIDRSSTQRSDNMTRTLCPAQLNTLSGGPLPLLALRQGKLLTVNIDQIPLLKDAGGPGIHLQPLRLDPERGEWVFLAVLAPGCSLPLHYGVSEHGMKSLYSWGPPVPPSFLAPDDLAELMTAAHASR